MDMRTIVLSMLVSSALCTAIISLLWLQNRRLVNGLGWWLASFAAQFLGLTLIGLRDVASDVLSVVAGNTFTLLGSIFLYVGLERYTNRPGRQLHNVGLVAVFILVHAYFTFVQPSVAGRMVNMNVGMLATCSQSAWLLLYRVDPSVRRETRGVGLASAGLCLLALTRIAVVAFTRPPGNDFMQTSSFDALLMLVIQTLLTALAFGLLLMVNRRLSTTMQADIAARKQAEERYQTIICLTSDFIYAVEVDADGSFAEQWGSKSIDSMTGYTRDEMHASGGWQALVHPDDRSVAQRHFQNLLAGQPGSVEFRLVHPDGKVKWLCNHAQPIWDEAAGRVVQIVGAAQDITMRKQMEKAIVEERDRLDTILSNLETGLSWIHPDMTVAWVNRKIRQMFPGREPLGQLCHVFYESRDVPCDGCGTLLAFQTGQMQVRERHNPATGRWYTIIAQPIHDEQGNVVSVLEGITDVTAGKQAERALRESEEKLRNIVENSTNLFYSHTPDHQLTYVSPQSWAFLDCAPEEALVRWTELVTDHPVNQAAMAITEKAIASGQAQPPYELELIGKKGRKIWVEAREAPVVEDGETVAIVGALTDVTARKQAEKVLQESLAKYHVLFDAFPLGITIADRNKKILEANQRSEQLLGIAAKEHITREIDSAEWQIIRPDGSPMPATEYASVHVLEEGRSISNVEMGVIKPDGEVTWIDVTAASLMDDRVVVTYNDITQRKRAERALQQYAERLRIQHQIDAAILAAQSPQEITQATLARLCDMIPCQAASIAEIDLARQRGRELTMLVQGKSQSQPTAWYPLSYAGRLIDSIGQGNVHSVADTAALETPSPLEQQLVANGLRSYVSLPLMGQDALQGVLNLASATPGFFQPEHIEILHEVASLLTIALQQARLREQAQRDAETRAMLLREVNHRVLNNLTTIVAILDMEQRRSVQDEADFRAVLRDVASRVDGMVTVHRMLSSAQWAPLDLRELVEQVIHAVLIGLPIQHRIAVAIDAPDEPLRLTSNQAIAMALVVNELTTNSVKYAFRDRPAGRIDVQIASLAEGQIRLTFRDDGPGLPDEVLAGERRSVGLWLVETNVRHILGGQIDYTNDGGAVATLTLARAPLDENDNPSRIQGGAL